MKNSSRSPIALIQLGFLGLFLLLANQGLCEEESRTVELSRRVAIGMAIRHNIDLRVRALDSSLAEAQIKGSTAIYNPYLTASVDFSRTQVAGETYGTETTSGNMAVAQKLPSGATVSLATRTGPISAFADPLYDYTDWSSAIGITLYQPLLKNAGRTATELGIIESKYDYQRSLETFREDVLDTVYEVIKEYNRLYVLYQLRESRELALRSARQLLEELKENQDQNENADIDIANTEYAISARQTELIEAERQVSSKEADLLYLIGVEERVHVIPLDAPSRSEPPETEKEAIEMALDQRPELAALRIQLEANEVGERVSRRNLWPDLALTASGGYRGYAEDGSFSDTVSQIGDGKGEYYTLGLRFSYPLGNDQAESAYLRDRLRSEQLRNRITATRWRIRDEIQEDNRDLISARLRLRSTAKSRQFAEQRVAQYRQRVRSGTAPVRDLIDAENDLINVRNQELIAVENFAALVARLWRDIGVLLERQNIHIKIDRPDEITGGGEPVLPAAAEERAPVVQGQPTVQADAAGPDLASPGQGKAVSGDQVAQGETVVPDAESSPDPSVAAGNESGASRTAGSSPRPVSYTLQIGEVAKPQLATVKKKIAQAGLVPVVVEGPPEKTRVYRMFIREVADRQQATALLESLQIAKDGGFVLRNGAGRYDVYAGSFFTPESAETGRQRMAARGISVTLREAAVSLPTFIVTAGSFSSHKAAEEQSRQLEQQDLKVSILRAET